MDLVYTVTDRYIESMRAEGTRVILVRRNGVPESTEDLVRALRGKELLSARALDADRIEAVFADAETATKVAQYAALGFDLGPFELETSSERLIRLVRRGQGAIDAIELVASTRADEWRRLMAHELDLVPDTASLYRGYFAQLASIRMLENPAADLAALYFNVRSPELDDVKVRRRIAAAINRSAVATLACGDPACASPPVVAESVDAPVPARLTVLVPEGFSPLVTAAKVLRHELWRLGLELDITAIDVPAMVDRMVTGKFDVALLPLSTLNHRFGFFLSPGHPKAVPITGFANPAYDAAVDRGDLVVAQAILDRELPVTLLFEHRSFAAIDARFCGDVQPSTGSWLWVSQLYPCEEGAAP